MTRRAGAFVLIIPILLLVFSPPVTPLAAGGWAFANVLAIGTEGFTEIIQAQIGLNGTIAVLAQRNERTGLYRLGSPITTIAEQDVALPDNLGTPQDIQDFQVDPLGHVVFTARIVGGTLPPSDAARAFRWSDGVVAPMQPDDGSSHLLSGMSSKGEWMTERISGTDVNRTRQYSLTNGVTTTLLLESSEQNANCRFERSLPGSGSLSASGRTLIYMRQVTRPIIAPPPDIGCDTLNETQTWQLVRTGTVSTTVATGGYQMTDGNRTGTSLDLLSFLINDADEAAFVREVYAEPPELDTARQQLVVIDALGERVLLDTQNLAFDSIGPVSFSATGQLVLALFDFEAQHEAIFAGPDLENDLVIGKGDQLFGQALASFGTVAANTPPSTFGDARNIVFSYELADGTSGLAVASKGTIRWTNASGGSWSTAGNWLPAEVPGQGASVAFGLDASYNVQVGTQNAGRVEVTDGSVGLNSAQLTLTGPLQVGGDADLVIPNGSLTAGEIDIGHLPPPNPAQPPLARLAVSNQNTTLTTGGPLRVGVAGDGQIDINSGAHVTSTETLLGDGSGGTANVRGANTRWNTGSIDVGKILTGTLVIESGARVDSISAVVGDATARPNNQLISRASVRGQASVWNIAQNINMGLAQAGDVLVENGATMNADELTMGVSENGSDATLTVQGSEGSQRSRLAIGRNATVGFLGNGLMALLVRDGALATIGRELVIGDAPGVEGVVSVGGRNAAGNPATLQALTLNGGCNVGRAGPATLAIFGDGLVQCTDVHVGVTAQGNGEVTVDGSEASPARLEGEFVRIGEAGAGQLRMRGGVVRSSIAIVVGAGGRIIGNGTLDGHIANGGSIEPDLAPIIPIAPLGSQPEADPIAVPGTLTISGTLAISATGVLQLDVLGKSAGQFDKVVVSGAATLGGVLRLNFTEGFAPKAGDVFRFVEAASTTGEFSTVVLSGLAPGFQYELGADGSLRALNDGVPSTKETLRLVYIPLLQR